ncbi:MAG: GNAT family N-acetyltransferase [Acidimicrobiales bacterium]
MDVQACKEIVRGLPEFFTIDVPDKIDKDLPLHGGWVISDEKHVLGFAIVERRGTDAAEILWAAIAREQRANGLGTQLIEQVLDQLGASGIKVVVVKTLDAKAGYQPYESTRAFWERCGFVQVDTIDPLPEWHPGNPAAIYVAALATTRAPAGQKET